MLYWYYIIGMDKKETLEKIKEILEISGKPDRCYSETDKIKFISVERLHDICKFMIESEYCRNLAYDMGCFIEIKLMSYVEDTHAVIIAESFPKIEKLLIQLLNEMNMGYDELLNLKGKKVNDFIIKKIESYNSTIIVPIAIVNATDLNKLPLSLFGKICKDLLAKDDAIELMKYYDLNSGTTRTMDAFRFVSCSDLNVYTLDKLYESLEIVKKFLAYLLELK